MTKEVVEAARENLVNREGVDCLQEGVALARRLHDHSKVGLLLGQLGHLYTAQGLYNQAEEAFQEALTLAHQAGKYWKVQALCALGLTLAKQGRDEQAQEYLRQGWAQVRVLQQHGPLGEQLAELGEAWWLVGNREQARNWGSPPATAVRKRPMCSRRASCTPCQPTCPRSYAVICSMWVTERKDVC